MSYKIQITVDEQLNQAIKDGAKQMGLSISSYTRLLLMSMLLKSNNSLLNQAISDINNKNIEEITLDDFNKQIDG